MNLVTILTVDRVKSKLFPTAHKFWTKVPRKSNIRIIREVLKN